jgi:hypothetical protein
MSRIFISGSSTGLGLMAADLLASKGHSVVLHARNAKRAKAARQELPQAEAIVVGDVETIAGAKDVAAQVNGLGHFDALIHNAAVGYREGHPVQLNAMAFVCLPLGAARSEGARRRPGGRRDAGCRAAARRVGAAEPGLPTSGGRKEPKRDADCLAWPATGGGLEERTQRLGAPT